MEEIRSAKREREDILQNPQLEISTSIVEVIFREKRNHRTEGGVEHILYNRNNIFLQYRMTLFWAIATALVYSFIYSRSVHWPMRTCRIAHNVGLKSRKQGP